MNPASDPLRYDPTKGVALYSKVTYANLGLNVLTTVGGAFSQDELWNIVDRFQMQSVSGGALLQSECGPGTYNGNGVWAHDMILDSGGGYGAVGAACGDAEAYSNNLMIFRGTGVWAATSSDGAFGGYAHYGGAWVNNTMIGPGISACPHCSAIESDRQAQYGPTNPSTVHNNLAVGWGQQMTYATGANTSYEPPNMPPYGGNSGNNGSDLPSNYATSTFNSAAGLFGSIQSLTAIPFPGGDSMSCGAGNNGSCFNLSPSAIFVHPNIGAVYSASEDWRLCTAALCGGQVSPVIGAGVMFSYSAGNGSLLTTVTPGNDIYGQSRASRVDLGCCQAATGQAPRRMPGGGFRLSH